MELETCQGCSKKFPSKSFLRHVGQAKRCKKAYGTNYEQLKREKTLAGQKAYRIKHAEKRKKDREALLAKKRNEESKENTKASKIFMDALIAECQENKANRSKHQIEEMLLHGAATVAMTFGSDTLKKIL